MDSTGMSFWRHTHSIPGEGKSRNDMKGGQFSQHLKRMRRRGGEGSNQQTAKEVTDSLDLLPMKGLDNKAVDVPMHKLPENTQLDSIHLQSKYNVKQREGGPESNMLRCWIFGGIGLGTVVKVEIPAEANLKVSSCSCVCPCVLMCLYVCLD